MQSSLDQGKDTAAQKPRSLDFAMCGFSLFNPAHGSRFRGPFGRNAEHKNVGISIDTGYIVPGAVDRPVVVDRAATGRQWTVGCFFLRKYAATFKRMLSRIVVHASMFH